MEFIPNYSATFGNMPALPYAIEEAVNRLRINLSFQGSRIKKILVISSVPNEGKSFVSMQLWRQMAEAEVKTVLLDMDLRNSVLMEKYHVKREDGEKILGTSYYLANEIDLQDCVLRTNIGTGDVLLNVDNLINPSMLLEGDRLKTSLDELAENYRYVIVDAPPLGLVSDGERIASLCDGAILVVRGGDTSKRLVHTSVAQLERAGCPLIGIVLSRAGGSGKEYYYKKYGKGYGYGYGYGAYGDRKKKHRS